MPNTIMKKILLVTRPIAPPWDEASKNFAFSLAKDLNSNENLELHLLTNGKVSELPENIIQEQIYTHSQNDFGFPQKIRLFWFLLCSAQKFDIIHLLFTPTKLNTFFIRLLLSFSKAKTIQTVATLREDIFSSKELKKMMFADLIITYSDYAKNKLEVLGIKDVRRIYPGIDLKNYSPQETRSKVAGYTDNDFVINFAGEYTRLGAMDDIVDSFIEVSKKIPNAKLSMAVRVKNEKDAAKKIEVIEKLKKNNLLERVVFHDNGKFNMSDIYNLADVSLFPVRNMRGKFDVPLVVVEAMACAKPVIISNLPILKEFSSDENSISIDPTDPKQLIDAIIALFENKEKCAKIGEASRKYVTENFDIKNVSKQYKEAYAKLR